MFPLNSSRDYITNLKGQFAVANSREIKLGKVISKKIMNHDVVIFRGKDGKLGVVDAFCSHLGAHLGLGGRVVGNKIQCPFHGLCFDREGKCERKPVAGGKITFDIPSWEVSEIDGIVFVNQDNENNWQLEKFIPQGFCRPIIQNFEFRGHPQEIIENTVDITHFYHIHEYLDIQKEKSIETKGHHLKVSYNLSRKHGLLGFGKSRLKFSMDINAKGLGYSQVDINIEKYGLKIRQIVMPTITDNEMMVVRALTMVKEFNIRIPRFLKKTLAKLICYFVAREFKRDFIPDIKIWENKKFIENPGVLDGELDILNFRKWCEQFYGN